MFNGSEQMIYVLCLVEDSDKLYTLLDYQDIDVSLQKLVLIYGCYWNNEYEILTTYNHFNYLIFLAYFTKIILYGCERWVLCTSLLKKV